MALLILAFASSATADVIVLSSLRDNTLYEDPAGALSNGAGESFFAGKNAQGSTRRGVLAFDVAANIPVPAVINSATLTLFMSQAASTTARNIELRSLLADWGEGTSNATTGGGGNGAPSTPNDATWIHQFFNNTLWSTPGGDFLATASAAAPVGGVGSYAWSSPQMAADVQQWLDNPGTNFGWLVLGDESTSQTAKRFAARESIDSAVRPKLTIDYTVIPEPRSSVLCLVAAGAGLPWQLGRRRRRAPGGNQREVARQPR
jgi:hypothetical protein